MLRVSLNKFLKQDLIKSSNTATYFLSSKLDEHNFLGNVGETGTNSYASFSSGLLLTDTPVLTDQQKLPFLCQVLSRGPMKSDVR